MATITGKNTADFVSHCVALATTILELPAPHFRMDYDQEADVLYMSFRKPQKATETIEFGDDILIRKSGEDIVGLTILNVRNR